MTTSCSYIFFSFSIIFGCNILLPLLILVYFSLLFFISYILKFSIMISSCLAQCDWVLLSLDIILAHLWWPNHQILLNLFCNTMTKIEILQQFHFFNTTFFVNKTKSWQMLKKFFYRIRYFIKSMLGKLSELTNSLSKKFCLILDSVCWINYILPGTCKGRSEKLLTLQSVPTFKIFFHHLKKKNTF